MNKRIIAQFIALTFAIALLMWGICAVFESLGLTIENTLWLYIFVAVCAFSPTISSYVVLKRNCEVKDFREWLMNVFAFKSRGWRYLLPVLFVAVYYIPSAVLTGLSEAKPFYMFFAMLPLVLIGGGIEEAGWSYVLRLQLDKRFCLTISSLITGIIWALWHIPVFMSQGRLESLPWFGIFAISCVGHSFAHGAIMRVTKNVWLCVLYHTLCNAVQGTLYEYSDSLLATAIASITLIIVSLAAVIIYEKEMRAGCLLKRFCELPGRENERSDNRV